MIGEIAGVPADYIQASIDEALPAYAEITGGKLEFEPRAIDLLRPTRDRQPYSANSAKSSTPVRHLGEIVGVLRVVALAPDDNTGQERPRNVVAPKEANGSPAKRLIIPRSRSGIMSEVHMTIATFPKVEPEASVTKPLLFTGNLDVHGPGYYGSSDVLIGSVGQETASYNRAVKDQEDRLPTVTLMTSDQEGHLSSNGNGTRRLFGDAYAARNPHSELQICAFLGITIEASARHSHMSELLMSMAKPALGQVQAG